MLKDGLLPGVPVDWIKAAYAASPGGEEVGTPDGKFASPASSAALAANGFAWFRGRHDLLSLPGVAARVCDFRLEYQMRFPWSGGHHPWLDVGIEAEGMLIGIESKRYEPLRSHAAAGFSDAFDRPVWREGLARYDALRRDLQSGAEVFRVLGAVQLLKHALGLASEAWRQGRGALLVYLYAEPEAWPDGRPTDAARRQAHRDEVARFAARVSGPGQLPFLALTWAEVLAHWRATPGVQDHAAALAAAFDL